MNDFGIVKIGYDIVFEKTIGLMDNVLIRMVKDLLDIKKEYNDICIYRNDERYTDCPLVISFDDRLFVDIKFNFDNRFGMRDNNIRHSFQSYNTILDNTYGVYEANYEYVRLDFSISNNKLIYDRVMFVSFDTAKEYYYDGWKVIFCDYCEAYKQFKEKGIDKVDNKIRWLSILDASSFSELDNIIADDLLSDLEKQELYDNIRDVKSNKKIIDEINALMNKEEEYSHIYSILSDDLVSKCRNKIITNMLDRGMDKKEISSIVEISIFEVEIIDSFRRKRKRD